MRRGTLRAVIVSLLAGFVALFGAAWGASAQALATFEAGHAFQGEDHVISLAASTDWASQGSRSLKVTHGSIPAGTANRLWIRVMDNVNWVGATHVMADFYVPPEAPHQYSAALMLQVGDGWTWYESAAIPLSPGENRDVVFRLDDTDWRTAATGWALGATVPLSGIRAYGLLVFSDIQEPGVVYVDNLRLVRPEALQAGGQTAGQAQAAGEARTTARSLEQQIQISGSAKLTVVSQPKAVPGSAPMVPVGLVPALWLIQATSDNPELVTTTGIDGNTVQALSVKNLPSGTGVQVDLGGADMSAYKYIQLDIKLESGTGSKGLQFYMQNSSWSWHDTQHFPHVQAGQWSRLTLTADQFTNNASFDDIRVFGFRTFDGDADFLIANVYFVGEAGDGETVTELTRTHEINLTLDWDLTPQWSLRLGAILADPVVRLGIVEAKGSEGPLSLRAFHNGKASDLGDPLKLFVASKYHENHATGLDATALVGPASVRAQYAAPSDGDQTKDRITTAMVNLPVGRTASASLLAANQGVPGKEARSALGAAGKLSLRSVNLTGEFVSAGADKESRAWMLEAAAPVMPGVDATVHLREYGRNVIPTYNDHSGYNGYGQRYVDVQWRLQENLDTSLYLQNWYRTDNSWNEILSKVSLNWRVAGVSLASFVETKQLRDPGGTYQFRSSRTSVRAATKLLDRVDVVGLVWYDRNQAGDILPTHLGRVSLEPLSRTTVTLEAAQVKTDPAQPATQNLYAKIARKIAGGELSLAYGKPTLNSDENAHNNTETAKDYIEVKLEISF